MSKYAMVENGVVANLIEWDGDVETWAPPEETVMVLVEPAQFVDIGWLHDGEKFSAPAPEEAGPEE
ncbi:hypothetical protein [Herbaspirillum frisingense]|uniref:hypothetical protein n=1 Tax=Herbaspirillum frisingense TaxID=92645 RepID=UPI0039B0F4FC